MYWALTFRHYYFLVQVIGLPVLALPEAAVSPGSQTAPKTTEPSRVPRLVGCDTASDIATTFSCAEDANILLNIASRDLGIACRVIQMQGGEDAYFLHHYTSRTFIKLHST